MKLKYEEGGYENENGTISDHKSRLHSCYAWGVLAVVVVSAGFMTAFGSENWQSMTLVLTLLPAITSIMMAAAPIPELKGEKEDSGASGVLHSRTAVLYLICIFFAGASESTMSQWASSYLETAFGINKTIGDLLGLALFGAATFYPQIVGVITDSAVRSENVTAFAQQFGYTAEQFGMKVGMCFAVLAPLLGSLLFYRAMKIPSKTEE